MTSHELSALVDQVISNNVSVVIGPESNVVVERVSQYMNKHYFRYFIYQSIH